MIIFPYSGDKGCGEVLDALCPLGVRTNAEYMDWLKTEFNAEVHMNVDDALFKETILIVFENEEDAIMFKLKIGI